MWFTAVDFPETGHVIKFDIDRKKFEVLTLAEGVGVPVGIVEDDKGRLWINDHATNLFFMFESTNWKGELSIPHLFQHQETLQPLYHITTHIEMASFGSMNTKVTLWLILILQMSTLVEYQIPTKSEAWGNTSNPLQFTLDNNGSAWFTEWTENKIGLLDSEKARNLPLWISVPANSTTINLDKEKDRDGKSINIFVYPNRSNLDGGIEENLSK